LLRVKCHSGREQLVEQLAVSKVEVVSAGKTRKVAFVSSDHQKLITDHLLLFSRKDRVDAGSDPVCQFAQFCCSRRRHSINNLRRSSMTSRACVGFEKEQIRKTGYDLNLTVPCTNSFSFFERDRMQLSNWHEVSCPSSVGSAYVPLC
jgi:hypothetical protein